MQIPARTQRILYNTCGIVSSVQHRPCCNNKLIRRRQTFCSGVVLHPCDDEAISLAQKLDEGRGEEETITQ